MKEEYFILERARVYHKGSEDRLQQYIDKYLVYGAGIFTDKKKIPIIIVYQYGGSENGKWYEFLTKREVFNKHDDWDHIDHIYIDENLEIYIGEPKRITASESLRLLEPVVHNQKCKRKMQGYFDLCEQIHREINIEKAQKRREEQIAQEKLKKLL